MTYQEAIEILHPDTTIAALEKIEYYAGFKEQERKLKAVDKACLIAAEGLKKLMEYEETGLTPEQIYEMDRLYTEKCKELEKLKRKVNKND